MLTDVESGRIEAIVCVDQDRLVRRMGELVDVIKLCEAKGVPLLLDSGDIDTTKPDGILKAHILRAVAENESRKKSERLKRQREQAATMGLRHYGGRRAYGYEKGAAWRSASRKRKSSARPSNRFWPAQVSDQSLAT